MTEDFSFAPEYIDIWRTRLDLPNDKIHACLDLLSSDEVVRADKFKLQKKYNEYVISRGLLRTVLGLGTGQDPETFHFEYTSSGKPYLSAPWRGRTIVFNVTHSHEMTLIAVSLDRKLGIDVEKQRDNVEFEKLSRRFFSEDEHNELIQIPDELRRRAFFACWTRKEAFVKATGEGIAFGLKDFNVSVDPDKPAQLLETRRDPDQATEWSMLNIEADEEYLATLAADGGCFSVRFWNA